METRNNDRTKFPIKTYILLLKLFAPKIIKYTKTLIYI